MKRNRANSFFLVVGLGLLMLSACDNKKRYEVLPSAKLEAVLYDYHLAQVIVNDLPSNQRYKKDLYFDHVYDKHDVTKAEVDSSLVYYARYPEGLSVIYANLSKRIEADMKRLEEEEIPLKKREAVAVVGDSADLWYDSRLLQLSSSPLGHSRYNLFIPTDTNFKAGDQLVWGGKAIFLRGGVDTLRRYLHLNLKVKYMNDSIASGDTLLYTSGSFSIVVSDTAVVKSVEGTAYLKSDDAAERLLIVEPSLMRYCMGADTLLVDSALIEKQVKEMVKKQTFKAATNTNLELQLAQ